ncbi:MAG: hypothetical protein HRT86_10770, partial [Ilumatobacteraceae bacterium]|nr:hypothetical protein [Ilumatobacteraceae bacterium]
MTATIVTGSQELFWRHSAPLRVAHQLRSQNRLAATVLAAICAFTLLLTVAASVSSLAAPGSETRVAAQTDTSASLVGFGGAETPTTVGPNSVYSYDAMSGCCVAPRTALSPGQLPSVDEINAINRGFGGSTT